MQKVYNPGAQSVGSEFQAPEGVPVHHPDARAQNWVQWTRLSGVGYTALTVETGAGRNYRSACSVRRLIVTAVLVSVGFDNLKIVCIYTHIHTYITRTTRLYLHDNRYYTVSVYIYIYTHTHTYGWLSKLWSLWGP